MINAVLCWRVLWSALGGWTGTWSTVERATRRIEWKWIEINMSFQRRIQINIGRSSRMQMTLAIELFLESRMWLTVRWISLQCCWFTVFMSCSTHSTRPPEKILVRTENVNSQIPEIHQPKCYSLQNDQTVCHSFMNAYLTSKPHISQICQHIKIHFDFDFDVIPTTEKESNLLFLIIEKQENRLNLCYPTGFHIRQMEMWVFSGDKLDFGLVSKSSRFESIWVKSDSNVTHSVVKWHQACQ